MNEHDQRIFTAEWMGWRQTSGPSGFTEWWHSDKIGYRETPPDFCHDLNAMHEVEKKLDDGGYNDYVHTLNHVCITTAEHGMKKGRSRVVSATAAQRAEAFCRMMWPERWEK